MPGVRPANTPFALIEVLPWRTRIIVGTAPAYAAAVRSALADGQHLCRPSSREHTGN
jgi:hypothetical protein